VIFHNRPDEDPDDVVLGQLRQVGRVALYRDYPPNVEVFLVTFGQSRSESAVEGAERRTAASRPTGATVAPSSSVSSDRAELPAPLLLVPTISVLPAGHRTVSPA
jgi:hypothetical protein